MPKTVVGLFAKPDRLESIVREIEALGFARSEVQTLQEPHAFDITGVMSFPRLDFEVHLRRALQKIGASEANAETYVQGLRRGAALVFATGPDERVDAAAKLMNQRGALGLEETSGEEPQLPQAAFANMTPMRKGSIEAGRRRHEGGGACLFVW